MQLVIWQVVGLRSSDAAAAAAAHPGVSSTAQRRPTESPSEPHDSYRQPPGHSLPPSLLAAWPRAEEEASVPLRGLEHFAFPFGVVPAPLRRSPSDSALNEALFGQAHLRSDAKAFVFRTTDGNLRRPAPLFGCCVHATAVLPPPAAPPAAVDTASSARGSAPGDNPAQSAAHNAVTSAPRALVLLSRHPFFDLFFGAIRFLRYHRCHTPRSLRPPLNRCAETCALVPPRLPVPAAHLALKHPPSHGSTQHS